MKLTLIILCLIFNHINGEVTKIAFGSCNKHNKEQPLWEHINKYDPAMWVWLGDIVYNDIQSKAVPFIWYHPTPERMKSQYDAQLQIPEYKKLIEKTPVIGVWDDHDYGENNGDGSNPVKEDAKRILLEFLNEDKSSPRWDRDGLYGSWAIGEPGRQVKIILLDARYNKNSTDFLGTKQWSWLENELNTNTAQITIIGSGIQVLTPDRVFIEKWALLEQSFNKLLSTLHDSKVCDQYNQQQQLQLLQQQKR
eukprot:TRINITY_DN4018_c0_g1_i4.p1 TRINITY_DN4018_c0_g1~~TRINITY_DN4018_c0_g1_i4.p1  ORF type:complete len:251 (-),score=56.86 TRINITY_DN4018_c0_g1_i4:12-764(-)